MTVELHRRCQDRLVDVLEGALKDIRVEKGRFVDVRTWSRLGELDAVLPDKGEARSVLEEAVGEYPVSIFIRAELYRDLGETQPYDGEAQSKALTEIDRYADTRAVAERYVAELMSLPWAYRLYVRTTFEGKQLPVEAKGTVSFGDWIRLTVATEDFRRTTPFGKPDEIPLGEYPPQEYARDWEPDAVYLVQDIEGYLSDIHDTATLKRAEQRYKAWCGLSMATGLLLTDYGLFSHFMNEEILLYRDIDGTMQKEPSKRLSADATRFLRLLRLNNKLVQYADSLEYLRVMISPAMRQDEASERLRLAASWLFDSYAGQNELLSFVQAVVCSEILLGYDKTGKDFGEVSITELLANRCAYLIATTQDERQQTLKDFRRIYATRSSIVHRGKQALSQSEIEELYLMRRLCGAVIRRELQLIRGDN